MGLLKGIHHIGLSTKSLLPTCTFLCDSFGFQIISKTKDTCVMKSENARLVAYTHDESHIDSVFDVALEVENVEEIVHISQKNNVEVLSLPKRVYDEFGSVQIAVIKSIVGNVVHTLINRDNYHGIFLPGFPLNAPVETATKAGGFVKMFDHLTYAVEKGMSDRIIEWYSQIFGMKRLLINDDESLKDGLIIKHNDNGMMLKAFDYWKCANSGVDNGDETCKFIIAEEISENVQNQIGTFLREHEGAGVQHIGLLVENIVGAARHCTDHGALFMTPPHKYYDNMRTRPDICRLNLSIAELAKFGILVDAETTNDDVTEANRFLMQVFTRPIFDRDSFFLELIERRGARGFGAGNIRALWDAVDISLSHTKQPTSKSFRAS